MLSWVWFHLEDLRGCLFLSYHHWSYNANVSLLLSYNNANDPKLYPSQVLQKSSTWGPMIPIVIIKYMNEA